MDNIEITITDNEPIEITLTQEQWVSWPRWVWLPWPQWPWVPKWGTTWQFLAKKSNYNFNTQRIDIDSYVKFWMPAVVDFASLPVGITIWESRRLLDTWVIYYRTGTERLSEWQIHIASQPETDAWIIDTKYISPLKLANYFLIVDSLAISNITNSNNRVSENYVGAYTNLHKNNFFIDISYHYVYDWVQVFRMPTSNTVTTNINSTNDDAFFYALAFW